MADRWRSVAAWLLLRRLLAERGLSADSLPITVNVYGKPDFKTEVGVHFSLSHAEDRVMAAISSASVGCDVERWGAGSGRWEVEGRGCLTADEKAHLAACHETDRDRAFIRLWVRKESYVKAVGEGMGIDPSSFSALSAPPASGWRWRDFDFGDNYFGSICFSPRLKK